MAPVSTTVLPRRAGPSTAAVSTMVSVPWVITMRFSGTARQRSRIWRRPASVIWTVSISPPSRHRPRPSMSPVCVLWKNNSPVSSLYSLSKVPPVTRMRMGCMIASSASIARCRVRPGDRGEKPPRPSGNSPSRAEFFMKFRGRNAHPNRQGWHGFPANCAGNPCQSCQSPAARYIGGISMRGMRWLLLVAIAAILGGVVYQYRAQKKLLAGNVPAAPPPLSTGLSATAQHWQHRDTDTKTGRIKSDIDAESLQQVKDASRVDLKNVAMKIYGKDGKTYDLVKSAAAAFNTAEKSLYSQGDVEITLNLPITGLPARQPTVVKTSGLTCDSTTGRVDTEQPSSFVFEKGDGKASGATYDPTSHELLMKRDAEG